MKLLFCPSCGDVVKLQFHKRLCSCGNVWGYYDTDGWHATVSKNAMVIGVHNRVLLKAVKNYASPHDADRDLSAWVMGHEALRVRRAS